MPILYLELIALPLLIGAIDSAVIACFRGVFNEFVSSKAALKSSGWDAKYPELQFHQIA
jgi:hypothetical protein